MRNLKWMLVLLGTGITTCLIGSLIYIVVCYGHSVTVEYVDPISISNMKYMVPIFLISISVLSLLFVLPSGIARGGIFIMVPTYVLKQAYRFMIAFHCSHLNYNDDKPFFNWFILNFRHSYSYEEKVDFIMGLLKNYPDLKLTSSEINDIITQSPTIGALRENFTQYMNQLASASKTAPSVELDTFLSKALDYIGYAGTEALKFGYSHPYLVFGVTCSICVIGTGLYWYATGMQGVAETGYAVATQCRTSLGHIQGFIMNRAQESIESDLCAKETIHSLAELTATTRNALVTQEDNMKFVLKTLSLTAAMVINIGMHVDALQKICDDPATSATFKQFLSFSKRLQSFVSDSKEQINIESPVSFPGVGERLGGVNPDRSEFLKKLIERE